MAKKVLIFYSETGGGHLRAAQALAEELKTRKNVKVVLYDGGKITNWGQKINPSLLFYIVSHYLLPLYNLNYKLANTALGVRILRAQIRAIWGENLRRIIEKEKPDLIVTTHHFISPSTTKSDQKIPFIEVVIDLGKPHRIWFDKLSNYIIVPDIDMANWASKKFKIEPSKLKALGYPLRGVFRNPKSSTLSNTILILGAGIESFLVTSWIKKIQKKLPDKKIIVVCGHNILLEKILSKTKDIKSFGFIDNLYKFLAGADIVITKAGPGIIIEAASFKKPVILVKWVGFQEKDNVEYVVKNNLGIYAPNGKNLIPTVEKIYSEYQNFTKKVVSFDTDKIVDFLISLKK